jgi:MraZ protein
MNQLTGEFSNTLDDKGRLLLPAKLRNGLAGNVVKLTQGVDNCVWLFTLEDWEKFSAALMGKTSVFHSRSRLLQRMIIGPAQDVEIDKAGRISIPQSLRGYAKLEKECVIIGIEKYVEIWSADAYRAYLDEHRSEFQEAAESLGDILF